jgi:hypothetical protein
VIYLIHSSVSLGGPGRTGARHYIGYCQDGRLGERMIEHLSGKNAAKIMSAFLERGASLTLARTWPDGGPSLERYLKKAGHFNDLCPLCRVESGKAPLATAPMSMTVSLPLFASRWRRRQRVSGGARSRGSRTISTGLFQAVLSLEASTTSTAPTDAVSSSGGTPLGVPAQPKPRGDKSAGTKQPFSSPSSATETEAPNGQPAQLA